MKKITLFFIISIILFGFYTNILNGADDKDEEIKNLIEEIERLKTELEQLKLKKETIKKLIERIDLLETKLEKLKIETLESNPFVTDAAINWGHGLYVGMEIASNDQFSAEVGYNFKLFKKKRRKKVGFMSRFGIAIGHDFSKKQVVLKEDDQYNLYSANAFYTKMSLGSPVFINFIGFSADMKYLFVNSSDNKKKGIIGFGINIEFWAGRKTCITLGFSKESRIYKIKTFNVENGDIVLPNLFKLKLGLRWFFK